MIDDVALLEGFPAHMLPDAVVLLAGVSFPAKAGVGVGRGTAVAGRD